MTAQASERLENLHPEVELGALHLYRVTRDGPEADLGWTAVLGVAFGAAAAQGYAFERRPQRAPGVCTGLYRGYIARFRLGADGRLALMGYDYPTSDAIPPDRFEELLHGDFWLVLAPGFFGPRTYVPFVDGRVVVDRSRWRLI